MSWQDQVRLALLARDQREQAYAPIISHYSRLAHHTVALKNRNQALLAAATSARVGGGSSTGGGGADNPVRAALVTSLEQQLAQTRADLSEQYKIQSTNAQRLLSLTDSLRQAEDNGRIDREELGRLRVEVDRLRNSQSLHGQVVSEKEKQLLMLQDEYDSVYLELSQLEIQNQNLKIDNASLVDRWCKHKTEEADRMNEANALWEEAKRLKEEAEKIREGRENGSATKEKASA
ncbi:hypothetical protein JCM11641_001432 [Rhodosporidiobolus odoratus]